MKQLTSIILILFLSLLSSPSWSDTLTFNKLGLGFGIGSPTPPNSIISEKECLEVISNGNVIYSDTKDVELDNYGIDVVPMGIIYKNHFYFVVKKYNRNIDIVFKCTEKWGLDEKQISD